MKSYKRFLSISSLAIASIFAITGCSNLANANNSSNDFEEYAKDILENEQLSFRSLSKYHSKTLTNEDYSMTFVQKGTKEDKKYIRFATAVALGENTSIADLTYVREKVDEQHPQIEKEVTDVYKSIQGEGESYWYFDPIGKQLTTEVQENDFYFACYTIEITNTDLYLNADISAYLKINNADCSTACEASYNALENGSNVVSYFDGTSLLRRHVVATNTDINGDYSPSKPDYIFKGYSSTNGGEVIESLPLVTSSVNYYAVFEHDHQLTHHEAKAPTCEDIGWDAYDTCECGYTTYHELEATGHKYGSPTYSWNGAECTGTIPCENDPSHNIVEQVNGDFVEDTPATCEEPQKGHYVATFSNPSFTQQSTEAGTAIGEPATGHDYSFNYSWTDNKCKAERICANDSTHNTIEEAVGDFIQDTPAGCETPQLGHYLAEFEHDFFVSQETEANSVVGQGPLGHNYGNPTYSWNGAECTAEVVCSRNSEHFVSEKGQVEIVLDDLVEKTGHYEATFTNPLFTKQSTEPNSVDTKQTFTISFVTGSSETVTSVSYKERATVEVNSLPVLVDRDDDTAPRFACWTLDNVDITSDFMMPDSDITLVAKWRALEKWTVKFSTGVSGVTVNDIVIDEDQGLESFVAPSFGAPYKIFNGWCYDSELTQDLGDTLDATKFVDHELTLYAKTTDTDVSNPSTWKNENGVYSGKGFTQVNSVVATKGKQISLDIEFPAFDKDNPFGETYIYFGGDSELWTSTGAVSGYFLCIHGSNAGLNDDAGGIKAPRSGSYQLFKASSSGNTSLVAGRRYAAPFVGSAYMNAYNAYIESGTETLTVNIKFILGETQSYIEIMGTKLAYDLDYQPSDGSFGFMTGVTNSGGGVPVCYSKIKNIVVGDLPETTITLNPGVNGSVSTSTVKVPYGSSVGELPVATREGFTFKGWKYNNQSVTSSFVPGYTSALTLTAEYEEVFDTWDGTTLTAPTGSGTQQDPYIIESGANLEYVAASLNNSTTTIYRNDYFRVTKGIDLNNNTHKVLGAAKQSPFRGYFDGCGHTIKNANVPGANYRGLFGYLVDADVMNINFAGNVQATSFITGGIAGAMFKSTINNCTFSGTLSSTTNKTGGIVGYVTNLNSDTAAKHTASTVSNCVNKATITLTNAAASNAGTLGGVVGYADNHETIISNCVNEGAITGGTCTGGVIGRVDEAVKATISNCTNKANISADDYVGGVIAFLRKNADSTITNCYNYGNLTSLTVHVGGVMGLNRGTASELYCANNVTINGTTVSASIPVGTNAAICYSNDKTNGGSILSWHLCNPL